MAARKGLARLVRLCCLLAALGYGGWYAYDELFKPGEIRRRVHEELTARFEGVDVEIGSARMRPFLGGVNVSDLKLIRRDDPTRTPFLHVPHAVIWHDKAEFPHRIDPAKIELEDARLRLVRERHGKWNVEGITKPIADGEQAPVLVLKKARVEVIDQKAGSSAVLDLQEMDVTVINDPVDGLHVRGEGQVDADRPVPRSRAIRERASGRPGTLDLGGIVLGERPGPTGRHGRPGGGRALADRQRDRVVAERAGPGSRAGSRRSPTTPNSSCATADVPTRPCPARSNNRTQGAGPGRRLTVENLTGKLGDSGVTSSWRWTPPRPSPAATVVLLCDRRSGGTRPAGRGDRCPTCWSARTCSSACRRVCRGPGDVFTRPGRRT